VPLAGRINAAERYAIDWIQVDPGRVGDPSIPEGLLPSFEGDPSRNESYLAYDEPLLAVGDGTVVEVHDTLADGTPQTLPQGLPIPELGGNYVVLDLGRGFYALYGHARPGTITVKQGDHVERGDVVGRLGNSGNSTEAHLHFHVMRGPTPLASTNWPYEISDFDVVGSFGDEGFVEEPAPGPRHDELPLALNVIDFPEG
jgi:murein DD-endopeptidase MepM/ murein hydrolase activator NlpD